MRWSTTLGWIAVLTLNALAPASVSAAETACPAREELPSCGECGPVPMPRLDAPLADYEHELFCWLQRLCYRDLGWKHDKRVRDTGPFLLGQDYGIHPAPRIFYSPDVVAWLQGGRREVLAPGAVIIKEMFEAPSARYSEEAFERTRAEPGYRGPETWSEWVDCQKVASGWAVMIKTGETEDGWFWASSWIPEKPGEFGDQIASNDFPFPFRFSDYGEPSCLRCHAVAETESTFSDLRNIEGEPGEPARFRVDESWREDLDRWLRPAGGATEAELIDYAFHGAPSATLPSTPPEMVVDPLTGAKKYVVEDPETGREYLRHPQPRQGFSDHYHIETEPSDPSDFSFPSQWADHVPAAAGGPDQFITSDNCYGCHGGLGGPPYPISMFVQTGPKYGDGFNISPYGEWRWSPMGLAGRDPIFHAQLETEAAIIRSYDRERLEKTLGPEKAAETVEELVAALQDTCLSCHGGMGQRQLLIDYRDKQLEPDMKPEYFYLYGALTEKDLHMEDYAYHKYGNLGREGISCTLCHHIDPPEPNPDYDELQNFLMHSTTGVFPYSDPTELNGPFDDVQVKPMQNALGITPKHNPYIQDSKMCGTCHTIILPNVDATKHENPFLDQAAENAAELLARDYGVDYARRLAAFPHSIEQATYLEWENSSFSKPGSFSKSCQDCHMPRSFHADTDSGTIDVDPIRSQIAAIQDSTYAQVDHGLPDSEITVPLRDDYRRHELVGLNAFLLEMSNQFDDVLGLTQSDYMTSATTSNALALENIERQAREKTVELSVGNVWTYDGVLSADVTLRNLAGHRLPSGVGFRRAWIEFKVTDVNDPEHPIFHSGGTNEFGMLVDLDGEVLPSEFLSGRSGGSCFERLPGECEPSDPDCFERLPGRCELVDPSCYQPHFDGTAEGTAPIVDSAQVQIYQELVLNDACQFTTSFIHRDAHVKDNRLLPRGWAPASEFDDPIVREFMESTEPGGICDEAEVAPGLAEIVCDPDYQSDPGQTFAGEDTVRYVVDLEGADPRHVRIEVNVYSQAFTPFWLQEKFTTAPEGKGTQRLYYLTSRLQTGAGSPIEGWKLRLASFAGAVVPGERDSAGAP